MFLKKWSEVYCTSELEIFYAAKNLLDAQNINYKTDTVNNTLRLSMNNLGNSGVALSRGGGVKDYYKILVEKKDENETRLLLSKR